MEIIVAICLWLGIVTSPDQVTDQVIRANDQKITKVMNDPDAMAQVAPFVVIADFEEE